MKKKTVKKTNKVKVAASKKTAPKKPASSSDRIAKKSKPAAKKAAPSKKAAPVKKSVSAKKKIEKSKVIPSGKVVKSKQKQDNKKVIKKVMKKPEPKKAKTEVKKAPVVEAKKGIKMAKPAPKAESKPTPIAKVEPKKVVAEKVAIAKPSVADEKQRYSEKELAEFRVLIVDKLDQAKKDYELLKNTLCHTDDHGTDDTSPTFKALEDGSDVLTREETAQLALRQEKFIQNLQNALVRIQNKTYGICRVTGKLIPKERLQRVPHATLSIDAKLVQQFNQ
jgi:DnaK suppressor protein